MSNDIKQDEWVGDKYTFVYGIDKKKHRFLKVFVNADDPTPDYDPTQDYADEKSESYDTEFDGYCVLTIDSAGVRESNFHWCCIPTEIKSLLIDVIDKWSKAQERGETCLNLDSDTTLRFANNLGFTQDALIY